MLTNKPLNVNEKLTNVSAKIPYFNVGFVFDVINVAMSRGTNTADCFRKYHGYAE